MRVDLPAPLGPSRPMVRPDREHVRSWRIVLFASCTSSPASFDGWSSCRSLTLAARIGCRPVDGVFHAAIVGERFLFHCLCTALPSRLGSASEFKSNPKNPPLLAMLILSGRP